MLVQDFLRNGGDVLDLSERFAIDAKYHVGYSQLVMLKYDQISSPFGEPIVRECRGVILDQSRNWNVVSRPFDKFFNFGEGLAAPIDWEMAKVEEKVDGSLMTLYHYDDAWRVASSGTPDASGNVNGLPTTFAQLFWQTWEKSNRNGSSLLLPPLGSEDLCFMFELTTPYNRVVVQHTEPKLTLLAVRNRKTGVYDFHERWAHYYPSVKRYELRDLEEVQAALKQQNGLKQEGFVIVNPDGSRVKMKNDDYVRFHHMRDSINGSPKAMLEIVRANESTEFLAHFPEWQAEYDRVQAAYEDLVTHLEASYEAIKHHTVQKDFALEAVKSRCSGALFALRSNKVKSVRHFLAEMIIKNLMVTLNLKGDEQ
jgi:T4 RnlA family RNA ligase